MNETDDAKIGTGSTAFGSLLLSMPVAFFGALWLHLLYGWPALEALAAYSVLGAATIVVISGATLLARVTRV